MRRVWDNDDPNNLTDGLKQLCRDWIRSDMLVVEIGSFAGASTLEFAACAGVVIAVDPFIACDGITESMLSDAMLRFFRVVQKHTRILHIWEPSVFAANRFLSRSVHAVYIDGSHRESDFVADVKAWLPKLRQGGLLMGHDWRLVGQYYNTHFLHLSKPGKVYPDDSWVVKLP